MFLWTLTSVIILRGGAGEYSFICVHKSQSSLWDTKKLVSQIEHSFYILDMFEKYFTVGAIPTIYTKFLQNI